MDLRVKHGKNHRQRQFIGEMFLNKPAALVAFADANQYNQIYKYI